MYIVKSLRDLFEILISLNILKGESDRNWLNIDAVSFYDNSFYFRGQSSKYNKITSSLSRNENYIVNEGKIFSEVLLNRKSDFHKCKTPIEIIAKMQHYGFPTRLIDFTINPLIALFFAVQDELSDDNSNLYICKNDNDTKDNNSMYADIISYMALFGINNLQKLKEFADENYDETSLQEIVSAINRIVFVGLSQIEDTDNYRLKNQSGLFALCGNDIVENKIVKKIKFIEEKNIFCKIIIPQQYKSLIKAELDVFYNINSSFVYPELTTYADYIKKKYITKNNFLYAYSQIKELFKEYKQIFVELQLDIFIKLYLLKITLPKQFDDLKTWVYKNELPINELKSIVRTLMNNEMLPDKYNGWNNDILCQWTNYEPIDIYNYKLNRYFDFYESIDLAEKAKSSVKDTIGKCLSCNTYFAIPVREVIWLWGKGFNDIHLTRCPECRRARKLQCMDNNY